MNTVNLQVLSAERFGSLNFVLAIDEDGEFYAYRETSPYFCFVGESEEEVLHTVSRAFELYKQA